MTRGRSPSSAARPRPRLAAERPGTGIDEATLAIYESRSADYEAGRTPRFLDAAVALGDRAGVGARADLGCGPGWYTAALGRPVVALDGAWAMVRRTKVVAPTSLGVQADLAALPFRRGALAGGWARNTYVHLRPWTVPLALADLHRSLAPDAPAEISFFVRAQVPAPLWLESREAFPEDDLPGRWFSLWPEESLPDLLEGAGFVIDEMQSRDEVAGTFVVAVRARRARTLPDTVGPGLRLLVCGLNPSIHAADAGVGFVTPGNRFWPAALAAGLVSRDRDPWHALRHHDVGMTDLVKRATPRASELTADEYRTGVDRLDRLCSWLRPAAVCVVGLAGWRAAVDRQATVGWQDRDLAGVPVYVMPSTSGLNARTSVSDHADHLRASLAGPAGERTAAGRPRRPR